MSEHRYFQASSMQRRVLMSAPLWKELRAKDNVRYVDTMWTSNMLPGSNFDILMVNLHFIMNMCFSKKSAKLNDQSLFNFFGIE